MSNLSIEGDQLIITSDKADSWFGDGKLIDEILLYVNKHQKNNNKLEIEILFNSCKSGELCYSIALILESICKINDNLYYKIKGIDSNQQEIEVAKNSIYKREKIQNIPSEYRKFILLGSQNTSGMFTLSKDIRDKCVFKQQSSSNNDTFNQLYTKLKNKRALILDDCIITRMLLEKYLTSVGILCHGFATPNEADIFLQNTSVDIIFLDLLLGDLKGDDWLRKKRAQSLKTPVIIISGTDTSYVSTILDALDGGAQEFIKKTDISKNEILNKVNSLVNIDNSKQTFTISAAASFITSDLKDKPEIILIGSSTGGTEALPKILSNLPSTTPPIVIVQHMIHEFQVEFANRLSAKSGRSLGQIYDGEELENGKLHVPVANHHLGIAKNKLGSYRLVVSNDPPIGPHRPSVDYLFNSASKVKSDKIWGILLTGMGSDGASGLLKMKNNNQFTVCQDQGSSVVFGMPKVAIENGAANVVASLDEIQNAIKSISRL